MDVDKLDGYTFERLICNLLKKMGFNVEHTVLSGDGGVDIVAEHNQAILRGRYLVQCKRWINTVGEPVVRDMFGTVLASHANKGIIITNSFFSEKAKLFAEGKNIELIDGNSLNQLLIQYEVTDDDSLYISFQNDHKTGHFRPPSRPNSTIVTSVKANLSFYSIGNVA